MQQYVTIITAPLSAYTYYHLLQGSYVSWKVIASLQHSHTGDYFVWEEVGLLLGRYVAMALLIHDGRLWEDFGLPLHYPRLLDYAKHTI